MGYRTVKLYMQGGGAAPDLSPAYYPGSYDSEQADRRILGALTGDEEKSVAKESGTGHGGYISRQFVSDFLDLRGKYIATRAFLKAKQDVWRTTGEVDAATLQASGTVRVLNGSGLALSGYKVLVGPSGPSAEERKPDPLWTPTPRIYGYSGFQWVVAATNLQFFLYTDAIGSERLSLDVGFTLSSQVSTALNVTFKFGSEAWLEVYYYVDDADQDSGTTGTQKPRHPVRNPSRMQAPGYEPPAASPRTNTFAANRRKMNM